MYLCYVDESGTPQIPGNSSHYILAGIAVPIWEWKNCDRQIQNIKDKYGLSDAELHVAWILRPYLEQRRIPNFESLDFSQRSAQIRSWRTAELLRLQRAKNPKLYRQTQKNFRETEDYVHLTHNERKACIREMAECISKWEFARLFAECLDKIFFNSGKNTHKVDEQSLEQLVSRFERYLQRVGKDNPHQAFGLLIHDNNQTVAKKHTEMMKKFHQKGTLWTDIEHIIETPLFVDSELTSMVQVADLCGYALRRYMENNESELFDLIFQRADQKDGVVVGVRHFTRKGCICKICSTHRRLLTGPLNHHA